MKFNDEDEKENIKRTEEIVKTVAFFIVIIPVIFIVLIITVSSIFTSSNIKYMEKFYILDVNNENKSIIINLIEQEKENISSNSKLYCDSLYRIEYYKTEYLLMVIPSDTMPFYEQEGSYIQNGSTNNYTHMNWGWGGDENGYWSIYTPEDYPNNRKNIIDIYPVQ